MGKKHVILFGTGTILEQNINHYTYNFDILYLTNNDKTTWGTRKYGYEIIDPSKILSIDHDYVIITTTRFKREVFAQLIESGESKDKILFMQRVIHMGDDLEITRFPVEIKNTKKAAIISSELKFNGAVSAAVNVAVALTELDYDVTIYAESGKTNLIHDINNKGISVVIDPRIPLLGEEETEFSEYEFIIVNVLQNIASACVLARHKHIIWWLHEPSEKYVEIYQETRFLYSDFFRADKIKRIHRILAVSKKAADNFNQMRIGNVDGIFPYGAPTILCSQKKTYGNPFVFVVISVIHYSKGQDVFLDAVDLIKDKYNDIEFWLVGFREKNKYTDEIIQRVDSISSVKYFGEIDHERIGEIYSQAHCIVCPSREETMSSVITEGMSAGKVCITTSNSGVAEYIEDEVNGLIFQNEDAASLAEKMEWVFTHKEETQAIGKRAKETYQKVFSMEALKKRLEKEIWILS